MLANYQDNTFLVIYYNFRAILCPESFINNSSHLNLLYEKVYSQHVVKHNEILNHLQVIQSKKVTYDNQKKEIELKMNLIIQQLLYLHSLIDLWSKNYWIVVGILLSSSHVNDLDNQTMKLEKFPFEIFLAELTRFLNYLEDYLLTC